MVIQYSLYKNTNENLFSKVQPKFRLISYDIGVFKGTPSFLNVALNWSDDLFSKLMLWYLRVFCCAPLFPTLFILACERDSSAGNLSSGGVLCFTALGLLACDCHISRTFAASYFITTHIVLDGDASVCATLNNVKRNQNMNSYFIENG